MNQSPRLPLGLTESQLLHYQQAFDLSYHVNYLDVCNQEIPLNGMDVLEVGGAMPASLVIDHLACNSWTGVEAPFYDEELGTANQIHRNDADRLSIKDYAGRYRHLFMNIESIPEDHLGQYDLIFSIACFEHIIRLPLALEAMYRCLRPGGRLFTMHSPIWSAYDGHHLPVEVPSRFDQSDPGRQYIFVTWGHLLQSRQKTFADLRKRYDKEFAEEIIYYTYNSNHINRYFSEDYYAVFEASSFSIKNYQLTFPAVPGPEVLFRLRQQFPGYTQFANNGILAVLAKE